MSIKIPDLEYNYELMDTIQELGKNLCSINLLIVSQHDTWFTDFVFDDNYTKPMIRYIIKGCPKLKTLTLESLRGWKELPKAKISHYLANFGTSYGYEDFIKSADLSNFWDISISKESMEALYKGCKELKDLKLTKIEFKGIFTEDEMKKILPDCNVEIKECHFEDLDEDESEPEWTTDDSSDSNDV